MAHFAQLDPNNIVIQVIVVADDDCLDSTGNENELIGIEFCKKLLGGEWKQTSYNSRIRKHYAGIGYRYDELRDAFIAPQPFMSWVFNEETLDWQAPVPYPNDEKFYYWDEPSREWMIYE